MAEPLKNQYFQPEFFMNLSNKIGKVYPAWDHENFWSALFDSGWDTLELKQRLAHASLTLGQALPIDFNNSIEILMQVYHDYSGFDGVLFSAFVMDQGLDHLEASLDALEAFTQVGTAEFAIRPFIEKYEEKTMSRMLAWSTHDNVHVRRLSSEGCRPRLPWAPALSQYKKDPAPILPILENLKDDPEPYVQKSVANCLNDISKDHPDLLLERLTQWSKNSTKPRKWIIKHALRGLIKAGNSQALELVGIKKAPARIANLACSDVVILGEKLEFSCELTNPGKTKANYLVDFIIYHQKANGTLAPKVFKLGLFDLENGETKNMSKLHPMVPITTRKYYSGTHKVAIQVNGEILAERTFDLQIP